MRKWVSLVTAGLLVCAGDSRLARLAAQGGQDPLLPQAQLDTDTFPSVTGVSRFVAAGGDLQAALNASRPGDEVVIQANATFTGNFTLPVQGDGNWILVRSSNMSALPAQGHRVDPSVDAVNMPRIVTATTNVPAIRTAPADCS